MIPAHFGFAGHQQRAVVHIRTRRVPRQKHKRRIPVALAWSVSGHCGSAAFCGAAIVTFINFLP